MDWQDIYPPNQEVTKEQRHSLYRLGLSRKRVKMLTSYEDADRLIKTLVDCDPRNKEKIFEGHFGG